MFSFESLPEVREQVAALPDHALSHYAELIAFLEITPGTGRPYNESNPDGGMRTQSFGANGEGFAVYLVLDDQRRVVMLDVTWVG